MRITMKSCVMGLALVMLLASVALCQGMRPEMWNGTHWKEFSKEVKVAYIKGVGNMADLEVAVSGKARAGCLSVGLVKELQGKNIEDIIKEVDKFYKENPDKITTPVVEVVVRQCTSLCKPLAPAGSPKK